MKFERLVVDIDTNCYVIYDDNTLETIIIDPGNNSKKIIDFIDKKELRPKEIVLTHCHYDHIRAVGDLKDLYKCSVAIHKNDVRGLKDPKINLSKKGLKKQISIVADKVLLDKSVIKAGEVGLRVIHTPGHTPGSICLKVKNEDIVFTGDTVFVDGVGRWDLEGGDEKKMKGTLINKVSKWDDKIKIYPGHGESGSMEYIRKSNREFLSIINR
ncbi:MBL fold metallo-hydrolase [Wukongibacter sp. M2B1]|uniref:MBL fold metallo-hydrolase n=1 Tax=Wukongibacter sp. M2B1 TaxID=3088895 RepID=UPI003D78E22A